MAEQLMDELEKAAQIILAAPNLVTTEQRHNAEEVFLNFRRLKSPYELCRQILETNDYIVFEAVDLIKIALIREWPLLSQTHTSSLRDYRLYYVMNKPNLPPYVEGSILQLITILIKRDTVNDSGQARQAILEEIENLIMTGDLPKKLLGYNLISIITQEYVLNFMSANIEWICIWEAVNTECVPLDMDINWKCITLVPAVIDLMFTLYSKIRENSQLAHHARTCLVQMVHIKRKFGYNETKIEEKYFIIYVERFLKFITSVNIIDEEAIAIAHIFKKLFVSSRRMFNFLSINKFKTFLNQMSRLTCTFLENSAQEESLCVSECLYKEAVDVIFGAWTSIVSDRELFSQGFLKPLIVQMFDTYLRCHLSPPEDSTAEEDNYQDILFLMKLLTNIVSKNILHDKTVFLQGLIIIMPMMTTDLFKFPCLCLQYFEMMMSFCKDDPQKVLDLPPELLQPLLTSIELGLFSFGHDVSMLCCNMIEILITQIIENMQKGCPKSEIMAPFLNLVITVILTCQVDLYFISNVCIFVYYLIYCYQDEYNQIVQNHLSTQSDEQVVQRLANAFKKLTEYINSPWKYVCRDKERFKNSFDEFVANLQGFLMIK